MPENHPVRGLSLMSGGLDSRLAILVLKEQGIEMEAVVFSSPFFKIKAAVEGAKLLGVKLHIVDFTADILELLKKPRHGFGGAMNPCIDCHARMIKRAGEMRVAMGFDFVSTGEVLGQRPMSQNATSLGIVERDSALGGYLLRPLSAQLLEPTVPETDGRVDRSRLLALTGRSRKPQIELAKTRYHLDSWPSPAGGCMLTESGFARKLREEAEHEGLDDLFCVKLLTRGRHFRLPGGTRAVVGRDASDNAALEEMRRPGDVLIHTENVPGPSILLPYGPKGDDLETALALCAAYSDHDHMAEVSLRVLSDEAPATRRLVPPPRESFQDWLVR
ncbi:MAG: tRNA 4-thiouridine(8) synthase ThiI [Kiritimatiellae bacterium]|nr:tRNA 4-thiouridine(8) synthase ThiI [Kiritimatiellia bacterium]